MIGLYPEVQRRFAALVETGNLTLPLLPEVASQVMVMVDRPDCDARRLADLLRRDPALTAHVLRLANSPIYAASTKLVSLQQIIGRLGFTTIMQLALVVASRARIFQVVGFDREVREVFRHSLAAALFGQEIARLRRTPVDEAFMAGLLHDIGRPLVLQALVDVHREVGLVPEPPHLLAAAELAHPVIGGSLIEKWAMPARIAAAVRFHHVPDGNELATVIALADAFAHARPPAPAHATALDLYPEDLEQIAARSAAITETAEALSLIPETFDVVVIGSGPAGQKAAVQAAKAGVRALVIEEAAAPGGACVHRGTIPSKTLRETAVALGLVRRRSGGVIDVQAPEHLKLASLMARLEHVVAAHQRIIGDQLERNGIVRWHGRARFASPTVVEVRGLDGSLRRVTAAHIVIATGSRPRNPPDVPIDHEHVLDSDSILSLAYLPVSLAVIGSGVIATEYASIFASLGVRVVMIDRSPRPLAFLEEELTIEVSRAFERQGGTYLGNRTVRKIAWDGAQVTTILDGRGMSPAGSAAEGRCGSIDDGTAIRTEKLLYCLGREANLARLALDAAGLAANARGLLEVDAHGRTKVPHIYAVGDVIGPPSLATTAMDQGRRAVCHALGLPAPTSAELVPVGVYAIPELATVGLTEAQACERFGGAVVGRARFGELARGQIAAIEDGLLKLVCDPAGRRLVGVQIVGEGATELVHVGQIAILAGWDVDAFIDNVFNFPTLAEGYRVAAFDVCKRRMAKAA